MSLDANQAAETFQNLLTVYNGGPAHHKPPLAASEFPSLSVSFVRTFWTAPPSGNKQIVYLATSIAAIKKVSRKLFEALAREKKVKTISLSLQKTIDLLFLPALTHSTVDGRRRASGTLA